MLSLFFITLIAIMLALPIWPYSRGWGFRPAAALIIVALLACLFMAKNVEKVEIASDKDKTTIEIRKTSDN